MAMAVNGGAKVGHGGVSYDLNSFTDSDMVKGASYYKHVRQGLYLPPAHISERRHLHDLRFLDRVPLTSVGGTMILVDANVHRAGVNFPELPYDDLLETEGFGRLCRDFGVNPVGLPNVVILHSSDCLSLFRADGAKGKGADIARAFVLKAAAQRPGKPGPDGLSR